MATAAAAAAATPLPSNNTGASSGVGTASAAVLELEGGVKFHIPSKTLLAEQLQYIKEVHAAVVRSSRITTIQPVAQVPIAESAAANVATAEEADAFSALVDVKVKIPGVVDDVSASTTAHAASATADAAGATEAAPAPAAASATRQNATPHQTDKRVFLQVLEIPPTCTTIDVLVAYFLALRAHPKGCNFKRLVMCVRSVGDLRLARQCIDRMLPSQPPEYVARGSKMLILEHTDALNEVAFDSELAAIRSGRGAKAHGEAVESEKEGAAGQTDGTDDIGAPAADVAKPMTDEILAEAGAVICDSHILAWAARLCLSPAAVICFVVARIDFVVVTHRCLFDFRGVLRSSGCLRDSLLVLDSAHSLLDLGKQVFSTHISQVVLDAALGNLEVLRARQMLHRDAQAKASSQSSSAPSAVAAAAAASFYRRLGDHTSAIVPPPSAKWFAQQELTFPGEIRQSEHFWGLLVSCVDFLRGRAEVGAAAVGVSAKLGGRDRGAGGGSVGRYGGSTRRSAAAAAITEEVRSVMAKEMAWGQPEAWMLELEQQLGIPDLRRVLRRVLGRLELQMAELRFDDTDSMQMLPLTQVCRFLAALATCDSESSKVIVSNAAPVVVSSDYRVQMFAKGNKTSKPTKRLTLTSLTPAPLVRKVLRGEPAIGVAQLSTSDTGHEMPAGASPLCVVCNTSLYLPQDLLPTVLLEFGVPGRSAVNGGSGFDSDENVSLRTTRLVVESPIQSKIFALNRGDDQEMLDNSVPSLQPFRNYGQLVRDASKVFSDGMVVVFRSFRDLHECLSTWQNFNLENSELGMLQPIYADKVIFFESEIEVENHDTMRNFRQACDTGRGGLLFVTKDGSIRNNHHFWGHYCRSLIVVGWPDFKPNTQVDIFDDLEFRHRMDFWKCKYAMLTEPTTELERQGFHLHYFSMLDSMGCIVDWLSRAIANASDYTACIVADRRYTKALAAPRIQDKPWPQWFDRQVDRMCLKVPPTTCRCLDRAKAFISTCYTSSRERRRGVTRLSLQQRRRRRRQGLPRSRAEILEDAYLASRGLAGHGVSIGAETQGVNVLARTLQDVYDGMRLEVQRSHLGENSAFVMEPLSDEESLSAGEEEDEAEAALAAGAAAAAAAAAGAAVGLSDIPPVSANGITGASPTASISTPGLKVKLENSDLAGTSATSASVKTEPLDRVSVAPQKKKIKLEPVAPP